MSNQKCCTTCEHVFVNEMTDERYCEDAEGEKISLRYAKKRPDWCPLLQKNQKRGDERQVKKTC